MAEPEQLEPATRETFDVRSANTGAAVIIDVPERLARSEADRLNAEAAEIVGRVDGRAVAAGAQIGQTTTYEVVGYEVLDERAIAAGYRETAAQRLADARDARSEGDTGMAAMHAAAAERLEQQADELVDAADAREALEHA